MEVPPIKNIDDNSIDFVVSFQVIEHIKNDRYFISEIYRVLKPGGKLILTTPNSKMTITRNPWHIREYTIDQMYDILKSSFNDVIVKGVYGNEKVSEYYKLNQKYVKKITRFDILNLQYRLPRWALQVPYDFLNRFNKKKLRSNNKKIVSQISFSDFKVVNENNDCLDFFCVATK